MSSFPELALPPLGLTFCLKHAVLREMRLKNIDVALESLSRQGSGHVDVHTMDSIKSLARASSSQTPEPEVRRSLADLFPSMASRQVEHSNGDNGYHDEDRSMHEVRPEDIQDLSSSASSYAEEAAVATDDQGRGGEKSE